MRGILNCKWLISISLVTCLISGGCVGGLAQLLYVIKGHDVPAAYPGLAGKRIVVIAQLDRTDGESRGLASSIERLVAVKLAQEVKGITIVPQREIDHWKDTHRWAPGDNLQLAAGVGADRLLLIDAHEFRLREGRTIFKGRCQLTTTVFDVAAGQVLYAFGPAAMVYPENGQPAIQVDERQFETFYLAWLSNQISRHFHKHDSLSDVASDAAALGLGN
jgi:hypothetical protein